MKKLVVAVALLVLLVLAPSGFLACQNKQSSLPSIKMHFVLPGGEQTEEFVVELAKSPAEQERGLMYRKELSANSGMLFVYPEEGDRVFWMKNTYVSLDMVFMSAERRVVGFLENVPILNRKRRRIDKPSKFVVELNAGAVQKHGILKGSQALFSEEL